MPTRFYLGSVATPAISPAFDSNWEQTGQAIRRILFSKPNVSNPEALTNSPTVTIPITTTQDILVAQFVSDPIRAINFEALNFSMVIGKCGEQLTTNNAHLAFSLRILSQDGTIARGTLISSFTTISEFTLIGAESTRIIAATPVTPLKSQMSDRIVLEVGIRAAAPSAAGTGVMRFGFSAATDFALQTNLTTDLNGWFELQQDLFGGNLLNIPAYRGGSGLYVAEHVR